MNNNYLQLTDVGKTYTGGYRGLGYVNFAMKKGYMSVFVGGPISGKSTLLAVISGLENLSSGEIILDGLDISNSKIADRHIGLLTDKLPFFDNKSVLFNLTYPLRIRKVELGNINKRIDEIVNLSGIKCYLAKLGKDLSRFDKVMCSIARLAMVDRKLYLIDNVFAGLSDDECDDVINLIKKLFLNKTVVVTVTNITFAKKLKPNNIGFLCYNSLSDYAVLDDLFKMTNTVASIKYLHEDDVVEIPCDINNDGTVTIFDKVIPYNKELVSNVFQDGIFAIPLDDIAFCEDGLISGVVVKCDEKYVTVNIQDEEYILFNKNCTAYNDGDIISFNININAYCLYDFGSERKISAN